MIRIVSPSSALDRQPCFPCGMPADHQLVFERELGARLVMGMCRYCSADLGAMLSGTARPGIAGTVVAEGNAKVDRTRARRRRQGQTHKRRPAGARTKS
jgi:hypothetical protein